MIFLNFRIRNLFVLLLLFYSCKQTAPEIDFLKRNTNTINNQLPSKILIFTESGCHGCVLSVQNWITANGVPGETAILLPNTYEFETFYNECSNKNQVFRYKIEDLKKNALIYSKGALITNNNNQLETKDFCPENLEIILNTLENAKQ